LLLPALIVGAVLVALSLFSLRSGTDGTSETTAPTGDPAPANTAAVPEPSIALDPHDVAAEPLADAPAEAPSSVPSAVASSSAEPVKGRSPGGRRVSKPQKPAGTAGPERKGGLDLMTPY
jgi:hypothetical protein